MGTSNRYWMIIDHAFPSPAELRRSLAALPREELLSFATYVFQAAHDVREPWRGPFGLSEDGTEDLTAFVVSQGETYWRELEEIRTRLTVGTRTSEGTRSSCTTHDDGPHDT